MPSFCPMPNLLSLQVIPPNHRAVSVHYVAGWCLLGRWVVAQVLKVWGEEEQPGAPRWWWWWMAGGVDWTSWGCFKHQAIAIWNHLGPLRRNGRPLNNRDMIFIRRISATLHLSSLGRGAIGVWQLTCAHPHKRAMCFFEEIRFT